MPFRKSRKLKMAPKSNFSRTSKNGPGSGFDKTWKNFEILIGTWMFLEAKNMYQLLVLQRSSCFCNFLKKSKDRCKKGCWKSRFSSKMATWASQLRLILRFVAFWCEVKKPCFWDRPNNYQKYLKIDPWRIPGSPDGHRCTDSEDLGSHAGGQL